MKKSTAILITLVLLAASVMAVYCLATVSTSLSKLTGNKEVTERAVLSQSITVSPASAIIFPGATRQYRATGHYNNGITANITAASKWTSSNTRYAAITPQRLANAGLVDGKTTIRATLTGVSGSTGLSMRSEIIFTSTKKIFAPVLTVKSGTKIQWCFADGTTSTSATPQKNYGSAGTRQNYLRVTPWSALTRVNIGYDGSDGGNNSIEQVSPQGVINVENMGLMAPYLQQWCSSYNNIPSLVFDNFINLDTIECYHAVGLTSISLHNTPALKRACFEACRLKNLNVSESSNLEDLRGAHNLSDTYIKFGTVGKHLWHLCVRDNPQLKQILPIKQFPVMQELLVWNDNQSGPLQNASHSLTIVEIANNKYTNVNLSNNLNLVTCNCYNNRLTSLILTQCPALTILDCHQNYLRTLNISSCPALLRIDAHNNRLTEPAVDSVLAALVTSGHSGGRCNLSLNSPPSPVGLLYLKTLISRGWSVTVSTPLSDFVWRSFDNFLFVMGEKDKFLTLSRELFNKMTTKILSN
jgi:hypothetical protein